MNIENAIISGTSLSIDRGCLTCYIHLQHEGAGQSFGGHVLYLPESYKSHSKLSFAGHFIYKVMQIADVTEYENLKGKCIRVMRDDTDIHSIGHIIKDIWFTPKEDFASK